MTTSNSNIDQYKLQTTFDGDCVIHTYKYSIVVQEDVGIEDAEYEDAEYEDGEMEQKERNEQKEEEIIEKWRHKDNIGAGGFGVVWLQEAECGKVRAVKQLSRDARNVNYSRELATMAEVKDNQNLFVKFIGWYENKDSIFVAMEYIELGDLSKYIKKSDIDISLHAKEITRQILEGLAILHERQICHRDIKPQNILVASLDPIRVKIADFGVSKLEKGTLLHTSFGTAGYCAPEILRLLPRKLKLRNSYTNAVDMWALGSLVHEILTSETPFLESDVDLYSTMCSDTDISEPQTDLAMISDFCQDRIKFPVEALEKSEADKDAIDFIEKLMIPNPRLRMSARKALQHTWLVGSELVTIFQKCRERLIRFIKDKKPGLTVFFTGDLDESLLPYSYRAGKLFVKLVEMGCPEAIAYDLGILALYDVILHIDDKKSIVEDPHLKLLKGVLSLILEICSLARERGVRAIRFVASVAEKNDVKEGDMEEVISGFANGPGLHLDTSLPSKILIPFIIGSMKKEREAVLERPILGMIITDGISRIKGGHFLESCLASGLSILKNSHPKGSNFAAFQFIRIGNDPETLEIFQSLPANKRIRNNVDYLSASDVLGDEGDTGRRWKEISKLFLGPLSRTWR